METLPEEILYKIYKYKHQLEFTNVLKQLIRRHNEPKIYFCNRCCDFYPITMTCDCRYDVSSDVVSDTDYSEFSEYSDDFWMYEL